MNETTTLKNPDDGMTTAKNKNVHLEDLSDTTEHNGMHPPLVVSYAEAMNPTRRANMEDVHVIKQSGEWDGPEGMAYIGIYDGHGGRDMVTFLRDGLIHHVAYELTVEDDDNDAENRNTNASKDSFDDMRRRLERAFLVTDIHARQSGILSSGSTVALCLIKPEPLFNRTILTAANVGDARVVLGKTDGSAERLTHDHTVSDPLEATRIEQSGGFLFKNRVLGILAITRSMGDQMLKQFVIAHPFVNQVEVTGISQRRKGTVMDFNKPFVIVACDGLWDVMSDQMAVDIVRRFRQHVNDPTTTEVAQYLVDEAIRRGTGDNITVIVAYL